MVNFISPSTDELRKLLERLYPDIVISSTGVALLAAQITDLENRYEIMHTRIDHQPSRKSGHKMTAQRVLFPRRINRENKYGTHNYSKQRALPGAT
jgi:hypothetical protein